MRLSAQYYAATHPVETTEQESHVTAELLSCLAANGLSFNRSQVEHLEHCRDCREFVHEFTVQAEYKRLNFPRP